MCLGPLLRPANLENSPRCDLSASERKTGLRATNRANVAGRPTGREQTANGAMRQTNFRGKFAATEQTMQGVPTEYLWKYMSPEQAAHVIILAPLQPVERHKFWHKKEMRIRPSKASRPRRDDINFLDKAKWNGFWEEYHNQWAQAFPIAAAKAKAKREGIKNPLPMERDKPEFEGMYSRVQFDSDMAYLEDARHLVRTSFLAGQTGEGPYMDGLTYLKLDGLMLAEKDHCKARLQTTRAILDGKRHARQSKQQAKPEHWEAIGGDEKIAMNFKHKGYAVRKVGLHAYEVKI